MKNPNRLLRNKSAIITVEIQCLTPEKFLNILWRKGLYLRNVRRESITSIVFNMYLKDYEYVEKAAKNVGAKIKIIKRKGSSFIFLKVQKRVTLILGILFSICIIYYLSTFIWRVDISTDENISPYETRGRLLSYGIRPGVRKSSLDIRELEEKFNKDYDDIMWMKVRIQGSSLKITVAGRQSPPSMISDTTPCNLVASRDGQVVRVYTTSGTSVVKNGDIVKKGQILVKGIQGKEGMEYPVHSKGDVIAKTYYEDKKTVTINGTKMQRTGKKLVNYYIVIGNRKYYLKNTMNKFKTYDKIVYDNLLLKKEVIYETKKVHYSLEKEREKHKLENQLYDKIKLGMDRKVKIVNKISNSEENGDILTVTYTLIGEENIAVPETIP